MTHSTRLIHLFLVQPSPLTTQSELEELLSCTLEPLLTTIDEFNLPPISLGLSGAVLDMLCETRRSQASLLQRLIESNKVELLFGQYYEPNIERTLAGARMVHTLLTQRMLENLELRSSSIAYLHNGRIDAPMAEELLSRKINILALPVQSSAPEAGFPTPVRTYIAPFPGLNLRLLPLRPACAAKLFPSPPADYLNGILQLIQNGQSDSAASNSRCINAVSLSLPEEDAHPAPSDAEKWYRVYFRKLEERALCSGLSEAVDTLPDIPPDVALLKRPGTFCFSTAPDKNIVLTDADSFRGNEHWAPEEFLLRRMMLDLAREYREAASSRQNVEGLYPEYGRLSSALKRLCRCRDSSFYRVQHPQRALSSGRLKAFFETLLFGQVDVDTASHPDIDPNTGWVYMKALDIDRKDAELLVVDTQLMRLHFLPSLQGSAATLLYKPRKINLFPTLNQNMGGLFGPLICRKPAPTLLLTENLKQFAGEAAPSPRPAEVMISKQTPGLLGLRFSGPLADGGSEHREFTFRAGIGAHLPNATTGFSLEYWVQPNGGAASSSLVELSWSFLLPSATPQAATLLALHSVGGISEEPLQLDQPHFLSGEKMEGGLYGARIVDGLSGLTTDWRTSKPLRGLSAVPQLLPSADNPDKQVYAGTTLRFYSDLSRTSDPHSPNTLFLSIV